MEEMKEEIKQKNSIISIVLIAVNMLLLLILFNIGNASEDQQMVNMACIIWGATVLTGIYTFGYHGKRYRIAKWLFGGLLLISIASIALVLYLAALGHAFKN
jgi:hypothetical protein